VLVLKRIRVRYRLQAEADADRATVQRAFDTHMPYCPVYRSIRDAIEVTTHLEVFE
jgi:uncharacterized OsmC-like protein